MRARRALQGLDDRAVPPLARRAQALAAVGRARWQGPAGRTLRCALRDSGLLGPGVLSVLFAACLMAATGQH